MTTPATPANLAAAIRAIDEREIRNRGVAAVILAKADLTACRRAAIILRDSPPEAVYEALRLRELINGRAA